MPEYKPEIPKRYVIFEVTTCRTCFHLVYTEEGWWCYQSVDNPKVVKDEDIIQPYCKLPTSLT